MFRVCMCFVHLLSLCLCSNLPRRGMRCHDCLYSRRHHLEHAGLWLFTHPVCDITVALSLHFSSLSLSSQIGCGSVTPWPTCSHKPIPPKWHKDKLNLMPCNKLSRLLCTVRLCVNQWRNGVCVHFLICMEIQSQYSRMQSTLVEVGVRKQG